MYAVSSSNVNKKGKGRQISCEGLALVNKNLLVEASYVVYLQNDLRTSVPPWLPCKMRVKNRFLFFVKPIL